MADLFELEEAILRLERKRENAETWNHGRTEPGGSPAGKCCTGRVEAAQETDRRELSPAR